MHFSIASVYGIALGLVGLSTAQSQETLPVCGWQTLGFEEMTDLPAMSGGTAALAKPVPPKYARSQWKGFYAVTSSPGSQFLMPQGRNFAIAPNPATTPAVIRAEGDLFERCSFCYTSFQFQSIFLGAFAKSLLGGISAPSSAVIVNATGTIWNYYKLARGETLDVQTWTFRIEPAKTLLGLALSAQPMQVFEIPCQWHRLQSLSFTAQAEDGANDGLVLAFDNFKLAQQLEQYDYIPNCRYLQSWY